MRVNVEDRDREHKAIRDVGGFEWCPILRVVICRVGPLLTRTTRRAGAPNDTTLSRPKTPMDHPDILFVYHLADVRPSP